jgi:hypothetical protein
MMSTFLNNNALTLLQIITNYLRKEFKVPVYSGMFDDKYLMEETDALFKEDPTLEAKLNKVKIVVVKIRDLIKASEKVNVSFGVYEGFNSLANTDIKQYRGLEVLKVVKSSFEPSFDDLTTH